jgi:predicted transcriptional regulator
MGHEVISSDVMARSKPFQVNLEPEQHRRLQALSRRRGRSMGSLVRESVAEYLVGVPAEEDPLADVIGMFEDRGPRPHGDVGEQHDAYLTDPAKAAADDQD